MGANAAPAQATCHCQQNSSHSSRSRVINGYTVRFSGVPDQTALSEAEVALIDEICAKHRNLSEEALVALTHELPEWSDPGKSSKPIPFEAILRAGKKGQNEIEAIQREAAADDFLDRVLAAV